jgi:hypothetical protein
MHHKVRVPRVLAIGEVTVEVAEEKAAEAVARDAEAIVAATAVEEEMDSY